jgi:hypothetical protein
MTIATAAIVLSILVTTDAGIVSAEEMPRSESFKPYKLVGDWKFDNSNSGRHYGGDIEVSINSINTKGIMHGLISYDGRQTNDQCGTKKLFADKPVEAEIIKGANEYRVTFQVECLKGESPRIVSWTLVCDSGGVCTRPEVQPWGRGVLTLTDKLSTGP